MVDSSFYDSFGFEILFTFVAAFFLFGLLFLSRWLNKRDQLKKYVSLFCFILYSFWLYFLIPFVFLSIMMLGAIHEKYQYESTFQQNLSTSFQTIADRGFYHLYELGEQTKLSFMGISSYIYLPILLFLSCIWIVWSDLKEKWFWINNQTAQDLLDNCKPDWENEQGENKT